MLHRISVLFATLLALPSALAADARIAGDVPPVSLDGSAWVGTSSSGATIPALVPGDLISDLARAGVIPDPWFDLTWRDQAGLWDLHAWNFTRDFPTPASAAAGATLLVFDSIKMAATVRLNGAVLGTATSQHLRYSYDVTPLLAPQGGSNTLSVAFQPTLSDTLNDEGRFQGCSGGWDWAPWVKKRPSRAFPTRPLPNLTPNPSATGTATRRWGARPKASAPCQRAS